MQNTTYLWQSAQYMSKGHHALQEEGFCNGISEIKNYIHVNSFLNGLKMEIASLTFNVIRNSVHYYKGAQSLGCAARAIHPKGRAFHSTRQQAMERGRVCFEFWHRISLGSPDWVLTPKNSLASTTDVLGFQAWVTTPDPHNFILTEGN